MSPTPSIPANPALVPGLTPAQAPGAPPAGKGAPGRTSVSGPHFAEILRKATGADASSAATGAEPLRFSRHALERVQRRGIQLDPTTLARLHEGVGRAAGKGSRDSLVLVDGTAFVVSIPNHTVVTAVGAQNMREHVFTNIDSAVIA